MREQEFQPALTERQTLGGGVLQVGDLGLLEDGSELGDALVSDPVVANTAKERQSGDGERAGVSAGADTRANTRGRFEVVAYSSFSIFVSLRIAASLVTPSSPMPLTERLQRRGGARMVREQACQRALTQKQTLGRWFECPSSLLERLQR